MKILNKIKSYFRPTPNEMADLLSNQLSKVSPEKLARLKRELKGFDARSYTWIG